MMPSHTRQVFFISDRTGITSEGLGEALLNQFDHIEFQRNTYPFIDTVEQARALVKTIEQLVDGGEPRPLIFSSIVSPKIRQEIKKSPALHIDFFDTFIHVLEEELHQSASCSVGRTHGLYDMQKYDRRMDAVNFSMNHDDGGIPQNLPQAELILLGVSRSGKTPTSLYLALHYGIKVANYPLVESDLTSLSISRSLLTYRKKLFGLTIDAQRLHNIRTERRPNSYYASLENCVKEVQMAEKMFKSYMIPYFNSTRTSIEELAAKILLATGLKRH